MQKEQMNYYTYLSLIYVIIDNIQTFSPKYTLSYTKFWMCDILSHALGQW